MAIATGMRQGELLGVQWSDIDFDRQTVTVQRALQRVNGKLTTVEPKTERSRREIDLLPIVVPFLAEIRRRPIQSAQGYVFTGTTGQPLDGTAITERLHARLAELGLPRVTFHALRHTTATLALVAGVDARVVMELLGHSQIGLTLNTYSHVIRAQKHDASERISRLLELA